MTNPIAPPGPIVFSSYADPAWHPGGQAIVFDHTPLIRRYRDPETGQYVYVFAESLHGLWTANVDGSQQRRLLSYPQWSPDWNPAGNTLAYEQGGDIWTMTGSDTGVVENTAVQLTTSGSSFAPSWRPDGEVIAFGVHGGPSSGAYVVQKSGGVPRLIGGPGWLFPDWSPSGDTLTFIAKEGPNVGICVADSSGQGFRMLWGHPEASVTFPRWSPDGTKIAFTGRRTNAGAYQLWIMEPDGSEARTLGPDHVLSFFCWAPDGREIAYVKHDPSDTSLTNGTIWVIDISTGARRQITFNSPSN